MRATTMERMMTTTTTTTSVARASARASREMGGRATSTSARVMVTSTSMRSRGRRPAARTARTTTTTTTRAVGVGGAGGDADDADGIEGVELGLGRAAMLGFLGTTVGDVLTRGDGPIEQLTLESSYVARHVNPMELARDALELGGFYVESVVLVWLVLGSALLLGFSQGLRNPIRTVSGRNAGQRAQASAAAFSEIEKAYETNVREQRPYELFNGRLAMLGTAFAFVGDVETGGLGPLEQVNREFGIPVVDEEIFAILFLAGVSFNVVSTGVTAFRRAYAKGRE